MKGTRYTALPSLYLDALAGGGFSFVERLSTPPQLNAIDWRVGMERWSKDEDAFLVTDGCRFYADEASPYRDEYFIMEGSQPALDLAVLEKVMVLHMGDRSFAPLDELDLADLVPSGSGTVTFQVPAHIPYPLAEPKPDGVPGYCLTYVDYNAEQSALPTDEQRR